MTKKLFKFEDSSMFEDSVNPNGKVIRYRTVFAINTSEEQAREDAKLDIGYVLVSSYVLPEGWNS